MNALKKRSNLLLFFIALAFASPTVALGQDDAEVKLRIPSEPLPALQKWRDIVDEHMVKMRPNFPLPLSHLIAGYLFVVPFTIAAGSSHSAVVCQGKVWLWGFNEEGQLGDGTQINRSIPWALPLEGFVTRMALGDRHSLALTDKGELYAWGSNMSGRLGDGSEVSSLQPIRPPMESIIVQIAAGRYHSVALTNKGEVLVWGRQDGINSVGEKRCRSRSTPQPVELPVLPDDSVIKIAAQGDYSCALTMTGRVFILKGCSFEPEEIPIKGAVQIATGYDYFLVLTDQGQVWAWGNNTEHQLGIGFETCALGRDGVSISEFVEKIAVGWLNRLAVTFGCGVEKSSATPLCANIPGFIVKIAAGYLHSLALTDDGKVFSWGANWYGQLGLGDYQEYSKPMLVPIQQRIVDIVVGDCFSMALTEDNEILTWGMNIHHQLGIDTIPKSPCPIVVELSGVSSLAPVAADDAP